MTDSFDQSFDADAGMFLFAGPDEEQNFSRTPANITKNFISEARQNVPTKNSAAPSPATQIRDQDIEIPPYVPSRPAAAATAPAKNKRKHMSKLRFTADDSNSANGEAAATTSSPIASAVVPGNSSSPFEIPPPKKRKRQAGKKQMNARVIPRSLDDCDAADKELIMLRETGNEWKTIRARWKVMTGEQTATSTLPNRYARLKSNFTVIKEEDNGHLIAAKREVEESFENQKWELVSRVVQEKGGENYAGVVLKRQYKKLMVSAGVQPPPGVQDPDFEIDLPESDRE